VTQQTFSGKTGLGTASLGATRNVIDVEARITAITSPRVRQGITVGNTTKVSWAGSYGLIFNGGTNDLVVRWWPFQWTKQDIAEGFLIGATHIFWSLRGGVTATFIVTY
jgi:hypothetical protein